jgi:hypothetical protein
MADPKLKAELEALRAQVEQMTKRFDERTGAPEPGGPESAPSPLDEVRRIAEELHAPQLFDLLAKYLSDIGQDIQDSKPRALIAAFVAGFLAGKALGR